MLKGFVNLFFVFAGLNCAFAKSPVSLLDWQSSEGLQRLIQSQHKADFPSLANQFQNQTDQLSCGPTTGAIVLNALRLGTKQELPKISFPQKYKKYLSQTFDPRVERYSPKNFMTPKSMNKNSNGAEKKRKSMGILKRFGLNKNSNKEEKKPKKSQPNPKFNNLKTLTQVYGQPIHEKQDFGLQLRQLHHLFLSHGIDSLIRVANQDISNQAIKQELINNLKNTGDYVVINYKRTLLGQKGGGHISPLAAYHKASDSFLIMDVNSSKYNWVWVEARHLIPAMRTFDTKENRGYLLLKEAINKIEEVNNS